VAIEKWFTEIVGCSESHMRQFLYNKASSSSTNDTASSSSSSSTPTAKSLFRDDNEDGFLSIVNIKTGERTIAGKFQKLELQKMWKKLGSIKKEKHQYTQIDILVCADRTAESIQNVDVAHLQSLPENRNAVFQVASNFNGIESISEASSPDSDDFTEKYIRDFTQGPAASVSAGAAAIARVHAAFYDAKKDPSEWPQTKDHQMNFLDKLEKHFPMKNGYIVYTGNEPKKFPKSGDRKFKALLKKTSVGYHQTCQVTTGHRSETFKKISDPKQVVDQVLCAAVNISQGLSGMKNMRQPNSELKCSFVLRSAYYGTYMAAILHRRKKLFLTLIGGGAFSNERSWIYDALLKAHLKWTVNSNCSLERVCLVLFNPSDLYPDFLNTLKDEHVPFRVISFEKGVPSVSQHFGEVQAEDEESKPSE